MLPDFANDEPSRCPFTIAWMIVDIVHDSSMGAHMDLDSAHGHFVIFRLFHLPYMPSSVLPVLLLFHPQLHQPPHHPLHHNPHQATSPRPAALSCSPQAPAPPSAVGSRSAGRASPRYAVRRGATRCDAVRDGLATWEGPNGGEKDTVISSYLHVGLKSL